MASRHTLPFHISVLPPFLRFIAQTSAVVCQTRVHHSICVQHFTCIASIGPFSELHFRFKAVGIQPKGTKWPTETICLGFELGLQLLLPLDLADKPGPVWRLVVRASLPRPGCPLLPFSCLKLETQPGISRDGFIFLVHTITIGFQTPCEEVYLRHLLRRYLED